MKKLLLILLSLMLSVTLALGLSSCADDGEGDGDGNGSSDGTSDSGSADSGDGEGGGSADSGDEGEEEIRAIYESYVIAVTASGETPLSYDEWLKTVKGDKGDTGAPGKDGTRWHVGTTAPTNVSGANIGDFYINTESFEVYYLTANGWSLLGSIKGEDGEDASGGAGTPGAPGEDGTVWFTGAGAPVSIAGAKAGDLYLDTASCDVYKYESGAWTKITNIKGDKGDDGEPGTGAGTPGAPGEDGTRWIVGDGVPTSHYNANVGDIYLNTVNCDFYKFTADGWVKAGSLKGDKGDDGNPGAAGTVWHYGEGAPVSVSGAKRGDFYLDTDSCDLYALEVTGWVKIANIKGDNGDDGEPGTGGGEGDEGDSELEAYKTEAIDYVTAELDRLIKDGISLTFEQQEQINSLINTIYSATDMSEVDYIVDEIEAIIDGIRNGATGAELEALRQEKLYWMAEEWNRVNNSFPVTVEQLDRYNNLRARVEEAGTEMEIHSIINDEFHPLIVEIELVNPEEELKNYKAEKLAEIQNVWNELNKKGFEISDYHLSQYEKICRYIQEDSASREFVDGLIEDFYAIVKEIQNGGEGGEGGNDSLEILREDVRSAAEGNWRNLGEEFSLSPEHIARFEELSVELTNATTEEEIRRIEKDFNNLFSEVANGGSSSDEPWIVDWYINMTVNQMVVGTDIDEFMDMYFIGRSIIAHMSDGSEMTLYTFFDDNGVSVSGSHENIGDIFTISVDMGIGDSHYQWYRDIYVVADTSGADVVTYHFEYGCDPMEMGYITVYTLEGGEIYVSVGSEGYMHPATVDRNILTMTDIRGTKTVFLLEKGGGVHHTVRFYDPYINNNKIIGIGGQGLNIELFGDYTVAGEYMATIRLGEAQEQSLTVYVYLDMENKLLYTPLLDGIVQFDNNAQIINPPESEGEAFEYGSFEIAVMDSKADDILINNEIYHDFKNELTISKILEVMDGFVDYDLSKARVIINGKLVTDTDTAINEGDQIMISPEGAIVINGIFEANGETIRMQAFIAGGATLEVFVGMYGGAGRDIYLNGKLVNYELERYAVLNEGDTIQMSIGGGSDKPVPPAEPENPGTSGGNGGSDSRQYMVCVITDLQTKPDDTWVDLVAGEEPTLYEVLLAFGVDIANVQVLYNEMLFAPNSNVEELEGVIIGANDKIFVAPVDAILITINVVNLGSMTTFIAMNTTVEWVIESYGLTGAAGYMLNGNEVTNPAEALITYNSELTVYPPSGDDENKNEDNEGYAPESGFYKGNYTTHVYDSLDNAGTIVYLALNPSYTCTLKKDLANRGVSLDTHDVYLNGVRVTEENGLLNQTLGYYYEDTEEFDHVIIAPKGSVLISLERINTPVMTAAVREGATLYEICEIYALDMLSEITLNGKVIKDLKNTVIKEGDSIVASMTEDVYGSYTGDL